MRSIVSSIESQSMFQSTLPASILEISSTLFISWVNLSPSETIILKLSCTCREARLTFLSSVCTWGKTTSAIFFSIMRAKPRTEVRGVLNSWETVERKSDFIWSNSFNLLLASFSSSDFCCISARSLTISLFFFSRTSLSVESWAL